MSPKWRSIISLAIMMFTFAGALTCVYLMGRISERIACISETLAGACFIGLVLAVREHRP